MMIHEDECRQAGIEIDQVAALARKLHRISLEMAQIGVFVFGGSGNGTIRFADIDARRPLILAEIGHGFDGGDGATFVDSEGFLRGE